MDKIKLKKEIVNTIKNNSYLDFDSDIEDETLKFSTRRHGDVGEEICGKEDITEVQKVKNLLNTKFQDLEIEWEMVDEWVLLYVDIKT